MRKIIWLLAIASTGLIPAAAHAQQAASLAPAVLTDAPATAVPLAEAAPVQPVLLRAGGGGNSPPTAVDDHIYLTCNSGGGFWMFTNDSDPEGDQLTITNFSSNGGFGVWMGHATLGILSIGAGPTPGQYTGSYEISDGHGNTDTATIHVWVYPGGPGGC